MAARTTAQAGNWSLTSTWTGGIKPVAGDTVTLNHAVTLNENTDIGTSATPNVSLGVNVALTINQPFTIASGSVLTLRGDVWQGATVTGNGTGRIRFDTSAAPAGTYFEWLVATPEGTTLVLRGTSGSRFRVETAPGSTPCRFSNSQDGYHTGWIDAEYTDFIRIGSSVHFAFEPVLSTGGIFRFFHCTFYRCGTLASANTTTRDDWQSSADPTTVFTFTNCALIAPLGSYSLLMPMFTPSTGAASITNCDVDGTARFYNTSFTNSGNTFRTDWFTYFYTDNAPTAGPYPVTYLTLTGPVGGLPDADSTAFTATLAGGTTVSGTATITPASDSGSFNPTSFDLSTGSLTGTFTYHPPAGTATHVVTVSNNGTEPGSNGPILFPQDPISYVANSSATSYTLSGPSSCVAGRQSAAFTVALLTGQTLASPTTITPNDAGAGGTFAPPTVTLSTGTPSASFTYTAPSAERIVRIIGTTNNASPLLTDPPNLDVTAGRSFLSAVTGWEARLTQLMQNGAGGGNYVALDSPPAPVGGVEFENHYDPILAYWHVRDHTDSPTWDAAIAVAKYQYRDLMLDAVTGTAIPGFHLFLDGMRFDYERSGDHEDRDLLMPMTSRGYCDPAVNTAFTLKWTNSREVANALMAMLASERLGRTHQASTDALAGWSRDHLVQWFDPTNATYQETYLAECSACKIFMAGITLRSLIAYYDIYRDSAIPPVIKLAIDTLWSTNWLGESLGLAFPYWNRATDPLMADPNCTPTDYDPGFSPSNPNPVLNGMIGPAYAWYARYATDPTEQTTYLQRYEDIFRGDSATGGWLGSDNQYYTAKQYNQEHLWQEDGLAWRAQVISPPQAATTHTLIAPLSATGQANRPSALFKVSLPASTAVPTPVTVTFHDGSAGGAFIPPSVVLTTDRPLGVTRYAPAAAADGTTVTISATNDGGLSSSPPSVSYIVSGVATIATGYTATLPAAANNPNHFSNPIVVALDPPGSVPPRAADSKGGTVVIEFGGGATRTPDSWLWLSAERPSASFRIHPGGSTLAQSIDFLSNSASLTDPAALSYTPSADPYGTQATSYTLTAPVPSVGLVGVASAPFTVGLPPGTYFDPDPYHSPMTVLPSDGGAGGTFSPPYLIIGKDEPRASATFTYTPVATGAVTISVTNGESLTDPPSVIYTTSSTAATGYSLIGPAGGLVGVASSNFTVALVPAGGVSSIITITPHDSLSAGTFNPPAVSLSTTTQAATFTFTPTAPGTRTITVTSIGTLPNPPGIPYAATSILPQRGRARIYYGSPD